MKENRFGVRKICDLYEKWRNIKKFKNSGTGSKATMENFQNNLDKICDLIGKYYTQEILNNRILSQSQKEEDLQFIQDQRTDRIAKGNRQ